MKLNAKKERESKEREFFRRGGVSRCVGGVVGWSVKGCGGALLGVGNVKRGEVWWYERWSEAPRGVGGVVGCR